MSTAMKSHKKPSTSTTVSVSYPSACIPPSSLPQEIIFSILKLLPVKSLLRFKCVSKDWLSLLSSPNFISIHLQETLKTPLTDSFIIYGVDDDHPDNVALLNIKSAETEPIYLVNPSPVMFKGMDLMGSINGLICLVCSKMIILWNPAMNLYKPIRLTPPVEDISVASFGFGYDSLNDDYKIVRIDWLKPKTHEPTTLLEVYSSSLDAWKRVHKDFPLVAPVTRSIAIVNGIPYWLSHLYQPNNQCLFIKILMYYDMQNGSFKHLSLPETDHDGGKKLVEWNGNLAIIVSSPSIEREDFVDILVYDEMGMCWNKISSYGPIGLKMEWWPMQCSKGGVIVGETKEGELMLYDPITNVIKTFYTPSSSSSDPNISVQ